MDYTTIGIGIFALMFGVYTCFVRLKSPDKFEKLKAMKEKFGEKAGTIIHTIAYTIVPVIVGISLILTGINGGSIF